MQTIPVRTAQNVVIHHPVASLGDRILAYFIDAFIQAGYIILCIIAYVTLSVEEVWIWILTLAVPFTLYHLAFEVLMNGQSPGKRAMSIRVIRLDGSPPSLGGYVLRWLFRLIEIDLLSGAVAMMVIIFGGKGQRAGDMAAGTTVVKLVPQVSAKAIFTMAQDDYQPRFEQVRKLTEKDIEIIERVLEVNRDLGNSEPMLAAAGKVKDLLGITTDLPATTFLYTVIKDFRHYTSLGQ
jgi:uncharacterized RDD family membrane protein YckC